MKHFAGTFCWAQTSYLWRVDRISRPDFWVSMRLMMSVWSQGIINCSNIRFLCIHAHIQTHLYIYFSVSISQGGGAGGAGGAGGTRRPYLFGIYRVKISKFYKIPFFLLHRAPHISSGPHKNFASAHPVYFRMQILAIITSEEMTYDLGSFFFTFQKQMEQAKSSVRRSIFGSTELKNP